MAAGLLIAYQYFRQQREDAYAECSFVLHSPQSRRSAPQGREERSVPVRVGEEVQEVLRRGGGELISAIRNYGRNYGRHLTR